jgi:hypothetical protein
MDGLGQGGWEFRLDPGWDSIINPRPEVYATQGEGCRRRYDFSPLDQFWLE